MTEMLEFDPAKMAGIQIYKILSGCIVPRPIGWISTVSSEGTFNAAPFSFFNGLSHLPPIVCFSASVHYNVNNRRKDTVTNVIDTKEFVFNVVSEEMVVEQGICSDSFPAEVDEFAEAKLTPAPSKIIKSPRIAESPVNFECVVLSVQPLPESVYTLVIGRVVYMHVRKDILGDDGRIDFRALAAVGRIAGDSYARTRDVFTLDRDSFRILGRLAGKVPGL